MEKFNQIVEEIFKLKPEEINDSLSSKDIPNWDSMNYLLFIAEVEKQFNVSFSMDEVLGANSLGAVKEMLKNKNINL
jgi:acyl carrier protein